MYNSLIPTDPLPPTLGIILTFCVPGMIDSKDPTNKKLFNVVKVHAW